MASPVTIYLASLQSAFAKGDATEHTHRPALKTLIENSVKGIEATNEPKSTERENKPDYIIRKGASIIGFAEAKDIGKDLKATLKTPQLKRYIEALPNLIVTNYLDFVWIVGGEKRMEICLGDANGKHIHAAADAEARWTELINSFCNEVTPTVASPSQLAKTLAGETRLLKDLVAELVIAKDSELLSQQEAFQTLLVPDLKPEEFADMYAQTAAYGLFTARVFEHTTLFGAPTQNVPDSLKNDDFSLEKAAYLIPKANPFLRQFFQHIASPSLNNQLRWLIEQIADSLRYADIEKVLHMQSRKQGFEDPIFHFYETFLAEYDRALRESRGVYYTPEPVVDFIVRGVDWLLRNKFDKQAGLADKDTLILDPATGTATFLRKVIDQIHTQVTASGNVGMWPQYVRERLLPRIFGFELMMAPYTVAHLKLALQLQEQGFEFQDGERLHVYLTNTLDQLHKQTSALLGEWIAKENEGAEKVKRQDPVQVVLGNPPYSGVSRNNSAWITELIKTYKTEPEGGPLKERKHWLNDDYVKFIRFAHDRILRTGHGVVAYITNHGWLDNPTFRGMRAQLMRDFDDIYVIDMHGNSTKKQRTPDALIEQGDDKNVFDIEQGVSITFLVKLPDSTKQKNEVVEADEFELTAPVTKTIGRHKLKQPAGGMAPLIARIHQCDLWGSRDHKYNWLQTKTMATVSWHDLQPPLPHLLLTPRDEGAMSEYKIGWSIPDIMPINSTGIVTARDDFVIDFEDESIKSRIRYFLDKKHNDEQVKTHLNLSENYIWRVSEARQQLSGVANWEQLIQPITYRPFDYRRIIYHPSIVFRTRENVMRHLTSIPRNLSLICAKQSKEDWGVFVTETIGGHKACVAYDVNTYFPIHLLQNQGKQGLNYSPKFLMVLSSALNLTTDEENNNLPHGITAEDVLAYIYAVLHAPSYRTRYAEYLKSDFPRIPIAAIEGAASFADVWKNLVPLGHALIDLHLLRKVPAKLQANFPIQGSGTIEKPRYTEPKGTIAGRVWINTAQYFEGVAPETWNFKVGGYQVCEKWLKDRKGRTLTLDDIEHYNKVVAALTHTRELMTQIDAVANGALWPKSA